MSGYRKQAATFIVGLLLILSGCKGKKACEHPQVLRLNMSATPSTFDPRRSGDLVSTCLHFFLFEGLTRLTDVGPGEPGVAEKVEVSKDGLTYLFSLRQSLWSDGMPVTASDFEFAWKSILNPEFPCPNAHLLYSIKNAQLAKQGLVDIDEVGIEVIDPQTLKVTLETPAPYFLEIVSFATLHPVPKHIAQNQQNWSDQNPLVVNGAFKLDNYVRRQEMELVTNEKYWDHKHIHLEKIKVSFIEDEMTALQMYERGELDILGGYYTRIPETAISSLKKSGDLRTYPVPGSTHLAFNLKQWPFDQACFRKALSAAIDRQEIVTGITQLNESPAYDLIPPSLKDEIMMPYHLTQDPKSLFDEALDQMNITKDELPTITLSYSKAALSHNVAQAIQQQWTETLGINVQLSSTEHKLHLNRLMKHQFQVAIFNIWAQYSDPLSILERFAYADNPKNYMSWNNPDYNLCLSQQPNLQKRRSFLAQAERILLNESPIAPIFHWQHAILQKPYLKNVHISRSGGIYLHEASIDLDEKGQYR
ncbi:MAG: peptide ABC transporter substrate-binding protein [Chlamydiales bacterium]|nr:peptide ABC transporter substrate-binding protein [Chlamydiales bacterium]